MIACPFCKGNVEDGAPTCGTCGATFDYVIGKASHSGRGGSRWGIFGPAEVVLPAIIGARVLKAGAAVAADALVERRERKLTEQERQEVERREAERLGVPIPKARQHAQWTLVSNERAGTWVCRKHAKEGCWRCGNYLWGLLTGTDYKKPPRKEADLSAVRSRLAS